MVRRTRVTAVNIAYEPGLHRWRSRSSLIASGQLHRLIWAEIPSVDLRDTPACSANVGHIATAL
jgi:hypothetical protein